MIMWQIIDRKNFFHFTQPFNKYLLTSNYILSHVTDAQDRDKIGTTVIQYLAKYNIIKKKYIILKMVA